MSVVPALVVEGHRLVREGPYRVVRHPGYLSSLCIWVGCALALQNAILICVFVLGFPAVYIFRISAEEDAARRVWRRIRRLRRTQLEAHSVPPLARTSIPLPPQPAARRMLMARYLG